MIAVSVLNYLMNEDSVSLGIFVFAGAGFILSGIKDAFGELTAKRIGNYARIFFFGSLVIALYWIAAVKFNMFQ